MTARPIIMSGESVRAILAGRKSQTRRVLKPQPDLVADLPSETQEDLELQGRLYGSEGAWIVLRKPLPCSAGQVLWVKEAWAAGVSTGCSWRTADGPGDDPRDYEIRYKATDAEGVFGRWRTSLHMPRGASRITLRVTAVKVERVQGISEEGAVAEGCTAHGPGLCTENPDDYFGCQSARTAYREHWDSINARRPGCSWEENPWCMAIAFERITP